MRNPIALATVPWMDCGCAHEVSKALISMQFYAQVFYAN